MKWNESIPDVAQWQPRADKGDSLKDGLLITCNAIQSRIVREAEIERSFNINNFDSGPGLEDFVRQQLSSVLPDRYSVDAGVVNDRDGRTAGDYDIVIRNRIWTPAVKLGMTPSSRRFHYPIEAVYSAIEVKQTLGFSELDEAMEKLVKLSRLNRPTNPYGHITENQHLQWLDRDGYKLNPLHTMVLGARIEKGIQFRDLVMRFSQINANLTRNEMVRELCVLDEGVAVYMVTDGVGESVEATFMWDRRQPLKLGIYNKEPDKSFYISYIHLLGHLSRSVISVQDVHSNYGRFSRTDDLIGWDEALFNRLQA